MNAYTDVRVLEEWDGEVEGFAVVVKVGLGEGEVELNKKCRESGVKFIIAKSNGLFGEVFCDFGENFHVVDENGELPISGMVVSIDSSGVVTTLDETRHGLSDGDWVRFSEVEGFEGINGEQGEGREWEVESKGGYTFQLKGFGVEGEYRRGGWYHQVKKGKEINFVSPLPFLLCFLANPPPSTRHLWRNP